MEIWQILLIVLAVLFIVGLIIFFILKNNKKDKIKVDVDFITDLINTLGSEDNIKNYTIDNARVKFELNDLSKADLTHLHTLSPKGVFVTNNNVKTLFKYESKEIIQMLNKTLK